jgi:hypothetical protein
MFLELEVLFGINPSGVPVYININNICSINGKVIKMTNSDILELTDESLHKLFLNVLPKKKNVKDNTPKAELLELFERLHKLTGGKGKPVFTLGRENKLSELLTKHRLTKEDLITAATNIGKDEFLQGENDNHKRYGDVDYLLRPDKAARWSEQQTEKKKSMF